MKIVRVPYDVESYIVDEVDRTITEDDIILYYKGLGYNVFKNYKKYLYSLDYLDKGVLDLFTKYSSGYPDLLLIGQDDGSIQFVEIKLDGDSLRPNQVFFNSELSNYYPVVISYFNSTGRLDSKDLLFTSKLNGVEKELVSRLEDLLLVRKRKGLKPLWVVSSLYESYGKLLLKSRITGLLSSKIGVKKSKVVWFIKNVLNNKK